MTLKKIAIIPARSGSKGLANKNILMLLDRPLIAYSIQAAINSGMFERVIVSTDSHEYKEIAESYGAEVILREEDLASDTATSFMVIEDVINKTKNIDYQYFMLLQPTSPFRNQTHTVDAISLFEENYNKKIDYLVSVCESEKSSSLIKCLGENNTLKNFDIDFSNYRRQNSTEYYPNGAIFIGKNKEYIKHRHFFGKESLAFIMNKEDSVDIDDRLDFELAISIATKKNKQKILLDSIKSRIEEKTSIMNQIKPITLIGHSIFDYWNIDKLCGSEVNNLGIAGISSKEYIELILSKGLISSLGNDVLLFSGTNDIVINGWKKEHTINWIKEIISYIKSINENTKVTLITVPNVRGRIDRNNNIINELNTYLLDELPPEIGVIQLGTEFSDKFGNLSEECTCDGLHFSEHAYKILEATIETYFK